MRFDNAIQRLHNKTPLLLTVHGSPAIGYLLLRFRLNPAGSVAAGIAMFGVGYVVSYIVWQRFTFQFSEHDVVADSGILNRKHRVIPYDRVQQVTLKAGLLSRYFGVTIAVIENAAQTSGSNIRLAYISNEDAAQLQNFITSKRHEIEQRARGVNAPHIGTPNAFAPGVLPTQGNWSTQSPFGNGMQPPPYSQPFVQRPVESILTLTDAETRKTGATEDPVVAMLWLLLIPVVGWAILLFIYLVSLVASMLANSGYKLDYEGDRFRIERGLLTKQATTVPVNRIQKMVISQNPVRKRMGKFNAELHSAAVAEAQSSGVSVSIPLATAAQIDRVLDIVVEGNANLSMVVAVSPKARVRAYLLRVAPALVVTCGMLAIPNIFVRLAALPLILAAVAWAECAYRGLGYFVNDLCAISRRGLFFVHYVVVPTERGQEIRVHQGPYQRHIDTVSLLLPTAGQGLSFRIVDVPSERSNALAMAVVAGERRGESEDRNNRRI